MAIPVSVTVAAIVMVTVPRRQRPEVIRISHERDEPTVLLPAFAEVVARYPKEKACHRAARRIVPADIANQRHEDLLGHVLRNCRISTHMQGKAVDRRVPSPIEETKGLFVSGQQTPY
jgi:hypothetical protein